MNSHCQYLRSDIFYNFAIKKAKIGCASVIVKACFLRLHSTGTISVSYYTNRMKKLKVEELNRVTPSEYANVEKIRLSVVLDNVRSLNNIGSVFRTSDAFLVEKIYLCGISATPPSAEIHKTALGAEDTVEWEYVEDTAALVERLKNAGYTVFAVEQTENSTFLNQLQPDRAKSYAVVLGNEVKGVQQSVVDLCDSSIEIPQFGTKHSLNVSVAAGIVIWQMFTLLR